MYDDDDDDKHFIHNIPNMSVLFSTSQLDGHLFTTSFKLSVADTIIERSQRAHN